MKPAVFSPVRTIEKRDAKPPASRFPFFRLSCHLRGALATADIGHAYESVDGVGYLLLGLIFLQTGRDGGSVDFEL